GQLVREQPWPRPVEIQEVPVRRGEAFANKRNMVVASHEGAIKRLEMAARQPTGSGTGRGVNLCCHVPPSVQGVWMVLQTEHVDILRGMRCVMKHHFPSGPAFVEYIGRVAIGCLGA